MKKWYKTKPTIVSYGAVDLDKYKTKNKIKNKYDAIFSGRLDEQTGILMYLEAIKILKSKRINFKLVVLGDGIFKGEVKDITEYLGFVKDPSKYYFESKFAFVSRYLAILEAFASKKLVFAVYDNPIKRDYLEMTPYRDWIVIAKNSKILADKVEYYLHNDKETGKLTEPAYRWVQKQTWERMTDNYLKLWGVKWCSET